MKLKDAWTSRKDLSYSNSLIGWKPSGLSKVTPYKVIIKYCIRYRQKRFRYCCNRFVPTVSAKHLSRQTTIKSFISNDDIEERVLDCRG